MTKNVPSSKGSWQILDNLQNIKDRTAPSLYLLAFIHRNQRKVHSPSDSVTVFNIYLRLFERAVRHTCVESDRLISAGFRWSPWGVAEGNQVSAEAPTHRSNLHQGNAPQQINLPVTLHLDCINVELGPITAIGRTWQSLTTVILASQERPLLNRADKAFSALIVWSLPFKWPFKDLMLAVL